MQVGTFDIEGNSDFYYSEHFNPYKNKNDFGNIASSLFGNTVKFMVVSKEFGDATREMHTPLAVKMDLSSVQNDQILRNKGLTIKMES